MDVRLTSQGAARLTVLPVVVVVCDVVLHRGVGRAYEVGLVVAIIVAVGVGEVLTALKVARTVTAVLVTFRGIGNHRRVEGAVMYPATLNGCCENLRRILLLSLHAYTVLGHVSEGDVSHLKALAVAFCIVCSLTDKVQAPAVHNSVRAYTLDGDVLTAGHSRHKAVVTNASAVIYRVIRGESCGRCNVADNTYYQGSAVLRELAENVGVGVCDTALGVLATAYVSAHGVKDVSDACYGGAVLRGNRDGVLGCIGDVEHYSVRLESAVIVICAYTLGVVEVCVARAVIGRNGESLCRDGGCGDFRAALGGYYLDTVAARLETDGIYTEVA